MSVRKEARSKTNRANPRKTSKDQTRCEEGGGECLPLSIPVRTTDEIELRLTLCNSSFRIIVVLDDIDLVDQNKKDKLDLIVSSTAMSLAPGRHALHWGYMAGADEWQLKSEVVVNGVIRFRQRKGDGSKKPYSHSFLYL